MSVRHAIIALLAAIPLVFSTPYAQEERLRIGVMDFESETVPPAELRILTDRLRIELFNTGEFVLLERERMHDILEEQGFQLSGCVATECIIEVGQLLGMEKMISGSIGRIGDVYTMSIRMIDVGTGALERTALRDCECSLQEMLTQIVGQVASEIAGLTWTPPPSVAERPLQRDEGTGMLYISSTPAGGRIFINGRPTRETTPATLRNVAAGEHVVRVMREHLVAEERVRVGRYELTRASLELRPGSGSLFIESDPPEAIVSVNGVRRGPTPLLIGEIPAGTHRVRIEAVDHFLWEEEVVIEFAKRAEIPVTLQPIGYITVIAQPADARVTIDGRKIAPGQRTRYPVATGKHEIEVTKADHETFRQTIAVEHGQTVRVHASLTYRFGILSVRSDPAGARISSDPAGISGTTPYRNDRIEPGRYAITLSMEDRVPYKQTIVLEKGKTTTVFGRLDFTQEYLERLEAERQIAAAQRRAQMKFTGRVLSFVGSAVAAGVGYKYNRDAQSAYDDAAALHRSYRAAQTSADATAIRQDIEEANARGNDAAVKRNVLYGASGVLFSAGVTLWVF